MRFFIIPSIVHAFFPQIIWKIKTTSNDVFLTFDDGPDPHYTPAILNILDEYQCGATFFILGKKAQNYPSLVKQIDELDHTIGLHSFEHFQLCYHSGRFIEDQLMRSKDAVESILGYPIHLFRPPYGDFSPLVTRVCRKLDLKIILWNLMTFDFDAHIPDKKILNLIEKKLTAGDILVFHDGHIHSDRTVKILPEIIEIIHNKGLKSSSLGPYFKKNI